MTRMQKKKMHDTTDYKGRNVEMNISKNKYIRNMEKKERARAGKTKRR